jgi:hypothetical protein
LTTRATDLQVFHVRKNLVGVLRHHGSVVLLVLLLKLVAERIDLSHVTLGMSRRDLGPDVFLFRRGMNADSKRSGRVLVVAVSNLDHSLNLLFGLFDVHAVIFRRRQRNILVVEDGTGGWLLGEDTLHGDNRRALNASSIERAGGLRDGDTARSDKRRTLDCGYRGRAKALLIDIGLLLAFVMLLEDGGLLRKQVRGRANGGRKVGASQRTLRLTAVVVTSLSTGRRTAKLGFTALTVPRELVAIELVCRSLLEAFSSAFLGR